MTTSVIYEKRTTSFPDAWKLKPISFRSDMFTSFEQWAAKCHLKETTLDTLRESEIDDLNTVKLLNSEDIRRLPIKLGQAKLLEWAVKKLRRCDGTLNTSKDTNYSPCSSPERKSDSFYIVPSPSKGRKSPTKVQQVNVDENMDADLDSDSSPCTIRITIETKKDDEMDLEQTGFIEEVHCPKNIIREIEEDPSTEDEAEEETEKFDQIPQVTVTVNGEKIEEEKAECEDEECEDKECEDEETVEENVEKGKCEEKLCDAEMYEDEECEEECREDEYEEEVCKEKETCKEECQEKCQEECDDEFEEEICEEEAYCEEAEKEACEEMKNIPEDEFETTRTDVDLAIKGEAILPPPPAPVEVPPEVTRVTLEIPASLDDLQTPVTLSADRRSLFIPIMDSLQSSREDLIKHAARRIVADSLSENQGDDEYTRDKLVAFLEGAYGSTLIRLSNDHGTLKFLVPQLSETSVQTEEEKEEEKEEGAECGCDGPGPSKQVDELSPARSESPPRFDKSNISKFMPNIAKWRTKAQGRVTTESVKEECAGVDVDSISGELSAPLCDLPPPAEAEEDETLPAPPQLEENECKPCDQKDSEAYEAEENAETIAFHIPAEVNKFGNYMQTQIMGECLHPPVTVRRPMSPVVSQPIRWECNRPSKDCSPPRIQKTPPSKTSPSVTHRTPSPQRFNSPDRASQRMRVSKGLPGSPAYKATGEIDPKRKSSPPKEIVNKIKNNIESPSKMGSANKPRSPSPVKQFDASSFQLARKLAQEVADCPPDCIIIRGKDLQMCPKALLPGSLNKSHLEDYVSNTDFRRIFKMDREDFCNLTDWHQSDLKRQCGLF